MKNLVALCMKAKFTRHSCSRSISLETGLISTHCQSTDWFSEAEDRSMICEIPDGRIILAGCSSSLLVSIDRDLALWSPSNSNMYDGTVRITQLIFYNLVNLYQNEVSRRFGVGEVTVASNPHEEFELNYPPPPNRDLQLFT